MGQAVVPRARAGLDAGEEFASESVGVQRDHLDSGARLHGRDAGRHGDPPVYSEVEQGDETSDAGLTEGEFRPPAVASFEIVIDCMRSQLPPGVLWTIGGSMLRAWY